MKKIAISVVFLMVFAILIYYTSIFSTNMGIDENIPQVVTVSASFKDIKKKVKGRGKIISAQSREIWVEDISDIKIIHVKQGEKIKKGQPLVTLKAHKIKKEKNDATMDKITAEYKLRELERGEKSESIVTANREMTLAKIEYDKQQKEQEVSKELLLLQQRNLPRVFPCVMGWDFPTPIKVMHSKTITILRVARET